MDDTFWQSFVVGLAAVVGLQALLIVGLMRELGELLKAGDASSPIEEGQGPPSMSSVDFAGMRPGRAHLVVFMGPGCGYCEALVPGFRTVADRYSSLVTLVPVVDGVDDRLAHEYGERLGVTPRTDLGGLASDWNVRGTPFAVAVDDRSRVRAAYTPRTVADLEVLAQRLSDDAVSTHSRRNAQPSSAATN
jgi:thiol-disulfide isomerase/thioredoxin